MVVNKYLPIDCGDYDMLEIACMDHYQVELQLDNEVASGIAERLETRDGQEFLWLQNPAGQAEPIRIDRIRVMTVHSRPARFESHRFGTEQE